MVDQLLSGCPEYNEIAPPGHVAGYGHNAKEQGGEGKPEPGDGGNGEFSKVYARPGSGIIGAACHVRNSTVRCAEIVRSAAKLSLPYNFQAARNPLHVYGTALLMLLV